MRWVGQNELGVGQNDLPQNRGEVGQNELHRILEYNIEHSSFGYAKAKKMLLLAKIGVYIYFGLWYY